MVRKVTLFSSIHHLDIRINILSIVEAKET